MTDEQMLILSSFAYFTPNLESEDFQSFFNKEEDIYISNTATFNNTCKRIFEDKDITDVFGVYEKCKKSKTKSKLYENLYKVKNIKIYAYKKSENGYEGYAFFNESRELIFVAKGTKITNFKDILTDIKIVITRDLEDVKQFKTHLAFVNKIISKTNYRGKVYFAGHSLGGGLAQFAIYEKMSRLDKAECITFNSVGVYQDLHHVPLKYKIFDNAKFKIVDYSFNYDLVGSFGMDVGDSVYLDSLVTFNLLEYHSVYNFYDFIDENGALTGFGKPVISNSKPLRWYINHKLREAYKNRTMDKTEVSVSVNNEYVCKKNDELNSRYYDL